MSPLPHGAVSHGLCPALRELAEQGKGRVAIHSFSLKSKLQNAWQDFRAPHFDPSLLSLGTFNLQVYHKGNSPE